MIDCGAKLAPAKRIGAAGNSWRNLCGASAPSESSVGRRLDPIVQVT
jgi:hypothetical protein